MSDVISPHPGPLPKRERVLFWPATLNTRDLGSYDWRLSRRNVRRVEQWLIDYPHRPIGISDRRYAELHARYRRYKARYPHRKPVYYDTRSTWM